jgi:hypothetical protein|tara:strand:+ start:1685 stop:1870 length:186 start_codon:yes stop_codon:yes gene_type:complete
MGIMREIDILVTKRNFSYSDVGKLTPVEREIYIAFAKEEADNEKKNSKPKDMVMGSPIDPL